MPLPTQAAKLQEAEQQEERRRRQQQEERRRLQEAELRRVEEEKERALGLQRRERELRGRLLSLLLSRQADDARPREDLLQPVLDILQTVSSGGVGAASLHPLLGPPAPGTPKETPPRPEADGAPRSVNGNSAEETAGPDGGSPEKRGAGVLSCLPDHAQPPRGAPADGEQSRAKREARSEQDKCNRQPSRGRGRASREGSAEDRRARERSRARRTGSREDGRPRQERRSHKKHQEQDGSPRRSHSQGRRGRRERSRQRRGSASRKRSRHRRRSPHSRPRSPSRQRSAWSR